MMSLPEHIEVEINTFCNRECLWCPNGYSSRGKNDISISTELWRAILIDLEQHNYKGDFAFHNYNEPLADLTILEKIRDARDAMPAANLVIYTNGDYLTRELLTALSVAGLSELRVTLYPGDPHGEGDDKNAILSLIGRMGFSELEMTWVNRQPDAIQIEKNGILISIREPSYQKFNNRGGTVPVRALFPVASRTRPCFSPFFSAAIDYLGNLKICCNIYQANLPENTDYVIGNVGEIPLTVLWNSEKFSLIRNSVARADFASFPICQKCTREEVDFKTFEHFSVDESVSAIRALRRSRRNKSLD